MGPRERDGNRQEADPSFSLVPHRTVAYTEKERAQGTKSAEELAIFIPFKEGRPSLAKLLGFIRSKAQ
jgi:hypothetical protein